MKRIVLAAAAAVSINSPMLAKVQPPAGQQAIGVLYIQLSPQRWRIGFADRGVFDGPSVENRILKEAAKLTLRNGFTWFAPIGDRPEPVETKTASDLSRASDANAPPSLHLRWGATCGGEWSFAPTPEALCKTTPLTANDHWQATTQVMMGHGAAPANGLAYDARAVLRAP